MENRKEDFSKVSFDPSQVPQRMLNTGDRIPAMGLGTFGNDRYSAREVAEAVKGAAEFGYRLFDCASAYGNEPEIGAVFGKILRNGIARRDLFVISKLWNDMHGKGKVQAACEKTLGDLRLDYLDMYLIHWPFANTHPKGAPPGYRDPSAGPYDHEAYMETWYQMEKLVADGLVRTIGTSNMTIPKLELLLRDAGIKPSSCEVELHPTFQQPELFRYCRENDILPIGYSPIGSPGRPERDRTGTDSVDIEEPAVKRIAAAHNVHPAVVCIKWAVSRGQVPVPSTVYRNEYESNLRGIIEDPLTEAEMKELEGVDRNDRLIKGVVFLWKGAGNWTDLWDGDGRIPG